MSDPRIEQAARVIGRAIVSVPYCAPGDPEPYYVAPSDPLVGVAGMNQRDVDRLALAAARALEGEGLLTQPEPATGAHTLEVRVDAGAIYAVLACHHDLNDMPWCGDYGENGELLNDTPTGTCWAKDWWDAEDEDCLSREWNNRTVAKVAVDCTFNGDSLLVSPAARSLRDEREDQ